MAKRYWSLVNVSGGGIYQELLSLPFLIFLVSEEHEGGGVPNSKDAAVGHTQGLNSSLAPGLTG